MSALNMKSLLGKLNDVCIQSLTAAASLCVARTNYEVEIEHWLFKLIENTGSDLGVFLRHFDVDISRVNRDLTRALDQVKTGNPRSAPQFSPLIMDLIREAWLLASIEFGTTKVRSSHLLLALVTEKHLSRSILDSAPELQKVSPEALRKVFNDLAIHGPEAGTESKADTPNAGAPQGTVPNVASKTPALDQYTIDLTQRAKNGDIDPVLGRDAEIRQVIDILSRRRQNNPILTGEAGVGKTAVAEGFALRIAAGDVPPSLQNVSLRTLDLGLLQAGAGVKGEFENRLKSVLEEVKKSVRPIILFIDEAHTLIGAGGQAGQGDAANMLKPALARGELRTIAATTWAEYKKYFERDAALARRFQVVKVEEPTEPVAVHMMRGLIETLENHHKIRILDEAVVEAVRLSNRYISGRQLPDKSISLLDTACARVAISYSATPSAVEDCRRTIERLGSAIGILERELAVGGNHQERLDELAGQKAIAEEKWTALDARWKEESEIVKQIREIRERLSVGIAPQSTPWSKVMPKDASVPPATPSTPQPAAAKTDKPATPPAEKLSAEEKTKLTAELQTLTAKLEALQGENPLIQVCVDAQAIAEVVSEWTGIPAGRMVADEIKTILNLQQKLEERIIGQSHALNAISQAIRTSRANMTDPRKPIGVFLMVGTSGVGKTETALALAELLYGGDQNMTVINMSEFKEEHKVSQLMGSPPGYVGYGEGGVLTEAVRRKPYSVVLLDEMEKAHPGVQDIFYQVFDKGMLRDGEGRDIDFKNTIILMTSNAATDTILKLCADPETRPEPDALAETLHPELLKTFKPAFLGRTTIVPYYPLADDVMRKIIELQMGRITRRVKDNYRAEFTYSPDVIGHIAERCKEVHTGARTVEHILTRTLLPELSAEFLARMAGGEPIKKVHVKLGAESGFEYQIL
jgi:type VI secretion system protein VasG